MNLKMLDIDQNYDKEKIGTLYLRDDLHLTYDSILVPEITDDGQLIGFSIIDRDLLIKKGKRNELYGKLNWKEKIKI